jgi:hypothetical protein
MGYLTNTDYLLHVQDTNWQQLISNNALVQKQSERYAQAKITSYLNAKYDCVEEFKDTTTFDIAKAYKADSLVVYNAEYYYLTPTADSYAYNVTYKVGDKVYYHSNIYTCIVESTGITPTVSTSWVNDNYTIIGVLPTDATKWTKGDNRSVLIFNWYVELAVFYAYTRISPRNIPQLRIDQKNEVIEDLKNAQIGVSINLYDLPLLQPLQGRSIRFNSTPKNIL